MEPWTVKYRPRNSSELQGQNKAVAQLMSAVKNKKTVMLYGPPGTGKTSAAYAIADELSLEIIEVNASDIRDSESIKAKLGSAIGQMSLFSKGKLILVDELDGVSGSADRGGLSELSELIDKTTFPIIMTANDPFDAKFSTLRKKSEMIEFHALAYPSTLAVLKRIAASEAVEYDERALSSLARMAGGDMRAAINDFQTIMSSSKKLSQEEVDSLYPRRQKETMINAMMRILKTTNPEIALTSLQEVDEDIDEVFLWIDENMPREYKEVEDLARAYDNISLADVFRGRIKRWQHWRFLVYVNALLTAGVALSKKQKYLGFSKYTRTTRILSIWQYNQKNYRKKAIAKKLAAATHTSERRVLSDTLPYIKHHFRNSKDFSRWLSEHLRLEKEEIAYLS